MRFRKQVQRELRKRDDRAYPQTSGEAALDLAVNVIDALIDEIDQRPKHGWISEKVADGQHAILVEARERLRRL